MNMLNNDRIIMKYDNLCLSYHYHIRMSRYRSLYRVLFYIPLFIIVGCILLLTNSSTIMPISVGIITTLYITALYFIDKVIVKRAHYCRALYRGDKSLILDYVKKYNDNHDKMLQSFLLLNNDSRWNMGLLLNKWFFTIDYGQDEIANFMLKNNMHEAMRPDLYIEDDVLISFLSYGNHYNNRAGATSLSIQKFNQYEADAKRELLNTYDAFVIVKNIDKKMHEILNDEIMKKNSVMRLSMNEGDRMYSSFYTIDDFYNGLPLETKIGVMI